MRTFFCFYGGKWRIAKRYPAPRFPLIIEPFAGAAGYSTRWEARDAILADADPVIAGLWRYLISCSAEEILDLPDIAAGQDVATLPVWGGARDLIAFWLNKGCPRPRRTASAWMRSGIRPGSFWGPVVRKRLAEQIHLIKRWAACNVSYRALPDIEATWFIDAPYQGRAGGHYTFGSKRIDYADLADFCRSRRGQVIVCEAQGADWLPFQSLGTYRANHTARGRVSAEAIWVQ